MIRKAETFAIPVLLSAVCCSLALGQTPLMTVLEVDIENVIEYQSDISDPSKFGTNPDVTPSAGIMKFGAATVLGDIVAVNGQPARGTFVGRPWAVGLTPTPIPGRVGAEAIADTTRISIGYRTFEFLRSDGTPIGTIMVLGLNGGSAPPGSNFRGQNFAIVGGTGAYLGVRGEEGGGRTPQAIPPRAASIRENPANRRRNGGGRVRWLLAVIPMSVPQIVTTPSGPALTHFNNSKPVTRSNPAIAGEVLSLLATGLGPTVPTVNIGEPFPPSPQAAVNSPIEVMVNGKSAKVLAAFGRPGTVDRYQVNFRVPPDTAKGTATLRLTAAWIGGPETAITVSQ